MKPLLSGPLLLVLLAGACRTWPDYAGAFDVPAALGVLQPERGGPFTEPIGFVGSLHGGQIATLALKQGRFLTDDPTAAFLQGNPLPTGQRRLLAGLFPYAHPDATVTVFAFDRAYQQVVEIPWIVGFDEAGFPIEPLVDVGEPVFEDRDGSGDAPQLVDLEVKTGWTATERWTITFDGQAWEVEGSRSGVMPDRAISGEPFVGVNRAIAFTIEGSATTGDRFIIETDTGSIEHPLDGQVLEVRPAPDQTLAAVILQRPDADRPELHLFDPEDPGTTLPVELDAFAAPSRSAWDAAGADLFVADGAMPGFWHLRWPDPADRTQFTVERIALPWPTLDVAPLLTEHGRQVFVASLEENAVYAYDLDDGRLKDVNRWRAGVQGIRFDSPIRGIEAIPLRYLQLETNDAGQRDFDRAVGVSLASGAVVFVDERTGCLVKDSFGPQTTIAGQFAATNDFGRSFEGEAPLGPTLAPNPANGRHVLGNPCGGITRNQGWVLRYDAIQQGWRVIGDLSGEQPSLAYEDVRYVSDDGEISFLLLSGSTPPRDGWRISFRMIAGITRAVGDQDGDLRSLETPLDQPSDPLFFHYQVGPRTGGWYPVDDRPHLLVAGMASDRVGRIDPQEGIIDATWD